MMGVYFKYVLLLFSHWVVSNSLWPHGLQHARPPCPLPSTKACWNSCPLSWWCHPTIMSSVVPFSSCFQSFPASEPLRISWPKIRASASASVLPMNIQGWFPLGLTALTSLLSKGLSRVFSNTTVRKHQFGTQLSFWSNSYINIWLLEKTIALTRQTFAGKVMSLLFNKLSRFIIAFLSRSKGILISWLQSLSLVILEPKKIQSDTVSTVSHLFAMKWWGHMLWS